VKESQSKIRRNENKDIIEIEDITEIHNIVIKTRRFEPSASTDNKI